MKLKLYVLIALTITGCTVVSNDRVFPKLAWYWSADAKEQRREKKQNNQYRDCRADLSKQLTLRRTQPVDLAAVGHSLSSKYGVSLVANVVLNEWLSGTTNQDWQTRACDVMWVKDQPPREQDLSWLLCFHSEWDGTK